MKTYSLEEIAGIICGRDEHGQVVAGGVQWTRKRLARGELVGYKQARRWRMTEKQLADALETLTPKHVGIPAVPSMSGLTRTSRRRLAS